MAEEKEYKSKEDLPETLTSILPVEAQELYLEGYQRGWSMYDADTSSELDRPSVAHRQGWTMVRKEFAQDEGTGKWHRKGEEPDEEESSEGPIEALKDLF